MSLAAAVTAAITILVALTGYLATYVTGLEAGRTAARLTRINAQLSALYGPLLAELNAGNAAWEAFTEEAGGKDNTFWSRKQVPTDAEAKLWIEWVTNIFQPRTQRMIDHVMTHADLLNEDTMPPCLSVLAANVAVYEVLAARWTKEGFAGTRYEDYVAPEKYQFPRKALDSYLETNFMSLKKIQQSLLASYRNRPLRRRRAPS